MMLRVFQKAGHKPIVLIGGGTTKVGDPSGKDETRKLLTQKQIDANKASIKTAFMKLLSFGDGPTDAILVDNDEWLKNLRYIEFLREYGRHFTINRMLTFDSVKLRLEREQPLTFLEFNYMLLQAYDFLELSRRYNCVLQMGGSDQWGNIINGIELARRAEGRELFGLTTALLTTSSGAKMGKSVKGAVWLNEDMLSPYDYWQFWRNTEDADVARFMRLFTDLPLDEIARLEALQGSEVNEAKKVLATEATALMHGRVAAEAAAETARQAFEEGASAEGLPTVDVSKAELSAGLGLLNASHAGGARRLDERCPAADQGRRAARERRNGHRRARHDHAQGPQRGRRHQAVARQEAPRAAAPRPVRGKAQPPRAKVLSRPFAAWQSKWFSARNRPIPVSLPLGDAVFYRGLGGHRELASHAPGMAGLCAGERSFTT